MLDCLRMYVYAGRSSVCGIGQCSCELQLCGSTKMLVQGLWYAFACKC